MASQSEVDQEMAKHAGQTCQRYGPCDANLPPRIHESGAVVKEYGMENMPRIGERVRVPFGNRILEGEVLLTRDFGIGPLITVAVEVEGVDEPMRTTYELAEIESATAA